MIPPAPARLPVPDPGFEALAKHTVLSVLDLETSVDPRAAELAHHRARGKRTPWSIRRIDAACILTAIFDGGPECLHVKFTTLDGIGPRNRLSEPEILRGIDDALSVEVPGYERILCTFNGEAFDIPLLALRAQRHRLFDAGNLRQAARSHDAMIRASTFSSVPWPSLREVAAGLGVPAMPIRCARDIQPPHRRVIKCETDVCATFLVALTQLAWERGAADLLEEGKRGLAEAISAMFAPGLHLRQFTRLKG